MICRPRSRPRSRPCAVLALLALLGGLPVALGPTLAQSADLSAHATTPFEGRDVVVTFQYHGDPATLDTLELAFETVDGTAVAGEDYVARTGTVRFTPADPSPTTGSAPFARLPIPTLADMDGTEGYEHFTLRVTVILDGETVSTQNIGAGIQDAWWLNS